LGILNSKILENSIVDFDILSNYLSWQNKINMIHCIYCISLTNWYWKLNNILKDIQQLLSIIHYISTLNCIICKMFDFYIYCMDMDRIRIYEYYFPYKIHQDKLNNSLTIEYSTLRGKMYKLVQNSKYSKAKDTKHIIFCPDKLLMDILINISHQIKNTECRCYYQFIEQGIKHHLSIKVVGILYNMWMYKCIINKEINRVSINVVIY